MDWKFHKELVKVFLYAQLSCSAAGSCVGSDSLMTVFILRDCTRVIFYVRRIGLYLYKYRIYGTISIYILKGLAFVYQLI